MDEQTPRFKSPELTNSFPEGIPRNSWTPIKEGKLLDGGKNLKTQLMHNNSDLVIVEAR